MNSKDIILNEIEEPIGQQVLNITDLCINKTKKEYQTKNLPYIQEKAENISRKVRENAKKGIYDINVVLNGNFKDDKELIDGYEKYKNLDNYINNTYDNEKNNKKYNIQGNNNYQNVS